MKKKNQSVRIIAKEQEGATNEIEREEGHTSHTHLRVPVIQHGLKQRSQEAVLLLGRSKTAGH